MGASPQDSAVDQELRSWDLDNLWIVGSSSFPRNASPNPTPTVGALALRAATAVTRTLLGVASHGSPCMPPAKPPAERKETPA